MSLRQGLCNRLSAIGLKQERVHSLVDTTMKWVQSSGPEWTIERLKDLKQYYLAQLAGNEYTFKTWVSCKPNGQPKGPWGSLDIRSRKSIAQTLNALNVYTAFVAKSATQRQLSKFLDSAESKDRDTPIPIGPVDIKPSSVRQWRPKEILEPPKPWSNHVFGKTRAPLSDGTTVPEDEVESWLADNGSVLGSVGLRHKRYRSDLMSAKILSFVKEGQFHHTTGGKVAFLQEPGYKLRAIANPYRAWQLLLDPLKSWSFSRLRRKRKDCTYNQRKGIEVVQQWLQQGLTVHSVDLSDATNLFPLSYQLRWLTSQLDVEDHSTRNQLDYFVRASRARWALPDGREVRWSRGQPLGLGPSFAVFANSHHHVMEKLSQHHEGDYVILGDDIAIVGDQLAESYKRYMTSLGCVVSPSKTISSNKLAEFAGRVILPDGDIPTFKWRAVSDRSFLDVVRSLGPTSKGLLKGRQRRVVNVLSEVPEFLGGLGWNPEGRPLMERILLAIDLGLMDEPDEEMTVRSSSSTHHEVLNKILYGRAEAMPIVASERHATPRPARSGWETLNNLLGVRESLVDPMLVGGMYNVAAPSGDPRGPTTLEVLERKVARWRRSSTYSSDVAREQGLVPELSLRGRPRH